MAITFTKSTYTAESKYVTEDVTIAEGATLKVWNDSIQVMSDVWEMTTYATYWDQADGRIKTVTYVKQGQPDATPAVLEQVKTYLYNEAFQRALQNAKDEAATINKGSTVKVVSGRSGKGTVGKVVVTIERPYQMGWRSSMATKFGIATSDEKVKVPASNGRVYENYKDVTWAWARNCELVEVPDIDIQKVRERAEYVSEGEFERLYKAS